MTTKSIVLQDLFLNQIRKEYIPVTIHLTNGFQLKGQVKGFDSFIVILESEGKQMMIYKHAISTITPARPVVFNNAGNDNKA
ncbi:MAG TPA: RNA chaperone Hfq [Candidatus Atribacteria bacterium]|nr:RNA chaperone Hfq [Candidatus Atribacteria bacterium]HPT77926.1 RNA chaperone Hfq [Candidatus Atribacteria bacterium]